MTALTEMYLPSPQCRYVFYTSHHVSEAVLQSKESEYIVRYSSQDSEQSPQRQHVVSQIFHCDVLEANLLQHLSVGAFLQCIWQ